MDREIKKAKYVLMICTETYYRRVMGEEKPGTGLGVQWEGNLIYQHLYDAGSSNTKFIPVIFEDADAVYIPSPVKGASRYSLARADEYEKLYARLCGQAPAEKPQLGKRRPPLAPKPVKTDVAMMLSIPIDVDTWNEAKWRATFFMTSDGMPPVLGLGFRNEAPARKIFSDWHLRYGDKDRWEELRVSIIEGEIPGEGDGYSVHIGPDADHIVERYKKLGFMADGDLLTCVSRINRMEVASPVNLERFKVGYRKFKKFLLAPGVISADGSQMRPMLDLGIEKTTVYLRHVKDIGANDPDVVILRKAE